jgi:hypothetical protein
MRIATVAEGAEWLKARGLDSIVSRRDLEVRLPRESAFRVPQDAGRKTALARALTAQVTAEQGELMLWITGSGMWPSSENPELFYGYRASLGDRRSLAEAPCHILQDSDRGACECLLDLVLYFSWDGTVVDSRVNGAVVLSHDEILTVRTLDAARAGCFAELLGKLKLERIT